MRKRIFLITLTCLVASLTFLAINLPAQDEDATSGSSGTSAQDEDSPSTGSSEDPAISPEEMEKEIEELPKPDGFLNTYEGEGQIFVITNQIYANLRLESSQPIKLSAETITRTLSFFISPITTTRGNKTTITLSGLEPFWQGQPGPYPLFRHEDGVFIEEHPVDDSGEISWVQNVKTEHHIFILPEIATVNIWGRDDPRDEVVSKGIGFWLDETTCQLTSDVSETINIWVDNITLDGDGHSLSAYNAFYLTDRQGIKITNCRFVGFHYAIILYRCNDITIQENDFDGGWQAMGIYYSSHTIVDSNAVTRAIATRVNYSDRNLITNNTIDSARDAMYISYSPNNTIDGNTINAGGTGIQLWGPSTTDNQISNNTIRAYVRGVFVYKGGRNEIIRNDIISKVGIYLRDGADNNKIKYARIKGISGGNYGILVVDSSHNEVYGCFITETYIGICIQQGGSNNRVTWCWVSTGKHQSPGRCNFIATDTEDNTIELCGFTGSDYGIVVYRVLNISFDKVWSWNNTRDVSVPAPVPSGINVGECPPLSALISPDSGQPGDCVTPTGEGYWFGVMEVSFGDNLAINVQVVDSETIVCTVPEGTGTVDVTVARIDGQTATFSFTYRPLVEITGIGPTAGLAGTDVTLVGRGFTEDTYVRLGPYRVEPDYVDPDGTSLDFTIPLDTPCGSYDVRIVVAGVLSNPVKFFVQKFRDAIIAVYEITEIFLQDFRIIFASSSHSKPARPGENLLQKVLDLLMDEKSRMDHLDRLDKGTLVAALTRIEQAIRHLEHFDKMYGEATGLSTAHIREQLALYAEVLLRTLKHKAEEKAETAEDWAKIGKADKQIKAGSSKIAEGEYLGALHHFKTGGARLTSLKPRVVVGKSPQGNYTVFPSYTGVGDTVPVAFKIDNLEETGIQVTGFTVTIDPPMAGSFIYNGIEPIDNTITFPEPFTVASGTSSAPVVIAYTALEPGVATVTLAVDYVDLATDVPGTTIPCSFETIGVEISINAEDGVSPAPTYIPFCGEDITLTGTSSISSTYKWTPTDPNKLKIVGPDDQPQVAVHGTEPSDTLGDAGIRLELTPDIPGAPTIITTHGLTVSKVDLEFRNDGTISPQNRNDRRDYWTDYYGTDALGVLTVPISGNYAANGMEIIGRIEGITQANTSEWNFRRDINEKGWIFTPEDAATPDTSPEMFDHREFAGGPPECNNDDFQIDEDLTPNDDNEIFVLDHPRIWLGHPDFDGADPGTVVAMRFHAREWLVFCKNEDVVSEILEWISSITIRKKADGTWERVGLNEIRELGPDEEFPEKEFTREEALAAQNE